MVPGVFQFFWFFFNGGAVKKLFFAIGLLALSAVFSFSQGLNLTGDLVTGFVISIPGPELGDEEGNGKGEREFADIRMKGESVDAPTNRLRLTGELDGGNYGTKFNLIFDFDSLFTKMEDVNNLKTFTWGMDPGKQAAYVWGDFFYNRLRLSAGKFGGGDNVWNTTLSERWGLEEFQTGVRAEVKTNLGSGELKTGILFKIPPQYAVPEEQYTFKRLLNEMIIGARLDNSVFSAAFAFGFDGYDNYRNDEQEMVFGFMYKGKPGMQTGIEAKLQNLGLSSDFPFDYNNFAFSIVQMLGYDFSQSIYGRLKIFQNKKAGEDFWTFDMYPFGLYKFSRWLEVGGELGFGGDVSNFADSVYFAIKPVMYYHLGAYATLGAYWYNRFINANNYIHSSGKTDPFYTELGLVFYWSF